MDIEHLAMLAKLNLSDEEKALFAKQVGSVIDYIGKLNELDTSQVEPTAHVLPIKNVFREDNIQDSLPRDKAMHNAPRKDENYYRVPKVIE